jgi:predicted nucleic acid-binding protein
MPIEATVAQEVATQPTTVITISSVLGDLNNGLDRAGIAKKYNLSAAEVAEVFKHPKLKGLRARRKITRISIVDDTVEAQVPMPTIQPQELKEVKDPNQLDLIDLIADTEAEV